jgi:hypothetical protein
MTYTAKAALCSEIRTKHSMQSEHRVEFFNVTPGGTVRKENARLQKVNICPKSILIAASSMCSFT